MAILLVICLFAPFPLWLIETVLPYPYLIEEIFKLIIIKKISADNKYWYSILLGIVFSLSESILYLINFFQLGNFNLFPLRILMTTTMHTFLFLLLYTFRSNKLTLIISFIIAVVIHFFFNYTVSIIF